MGTLVAGLMACSGSSALAASQQVHVGDNFFDPSAVAVTPGDTVTWNNPGSDDLHNVAFETAAPGDPMAGFPPEPTRGPWTATRTFNTAGSFRYYCEEHGGPGGQGMSGVVFVNATGTVPGTPPAASFTASSSPAATGQSVSFNASGSNDPDGSIVKYEWDLDGNGTYETNTGASPTTSRVYNGAGAVTVKLRVTDDIGATGETTRSLTVTSPPVASFTASPAPAATGQTVTFDGSGSNDPDGTIAKYEWDLDGNGSYETDTRTTPTTSRSYAATGTLTIGLRVTDNAGVSSETTRSLQVNAPPKPPPQTPNQPVAPTSAVGALPPPLPSFASTRGTLRTNRSGRFSYAFKALPGLTGTIRFVSTKKLSISASRRMSLGTKRFTVPSSGAVKVRVKLSRRNLRTLRRLRKIRFRATITLRNAAGLSRSAAKSLTLRAPRGR